MKKSVCAILCFLVLGAAVSLFPDQNGRMEFVLSAGGFNPSLYIYTPFDPTVRESPASGPLLTVTVPPSPKSGGLFLDVTSQITCAWSGLTPERKVYVLWSASVNSPLFPSGIEVWTGNTILQYGDTILAHAPIGWNRTNRRSMIMMMRDTYLTSWVSGFDVRTTGTNDKIPENEAITLVNALMKEGFDLVFQFEGSVQGVQDILLTQLAVMVNRLEK